MTGNEMIVTTYKIAEETHEMPSITFTYAMLAETARMVNCSAYGDKELPGSILEKWLYIADEYYRIGHYLFALEYYGKAIETVDEFLAFIKKVVSAYFETIRKPKRVFLETDPVEYTERYITILPELEAKIEAGLIDESQLSDIYCFIYWNKKEEILKRDYGIEWESPTSMNPHVRFN